MYRVRMDRCLRLCLIHVHEPLRDAFRALGCEVLWLMPAAGAVLHLPTELAAHGFSPDIVFQQELLGPRLLLSGLDELSAVRLFWAVDPHLNAFWHAAYLRLFDATFSTQRRSLPELRALGAGHVLHLPWYAPEAPFTPFAERQRDAGFVGRLGLSRPVRTWLVDLLREALPGRFEAQDNLDFAGMLAFYQATRLAPNESISGEINFRLFEAAGCGCVVLAQDLGQEQAELFEPGREMLVCADALELVETAQMLCARPRLAEALGRAAWERARAQHLPVARAKSILETAGRAGRLGADAASGLRWLALALAGLLEAGRLDSGREGVAASLRSLDDPDQPNGPDEQVLAARIRVAVALGQQAEIEDLLRRCHAAGTLSLPLLLTCSMAALQRGLNQDCGADVALAREFADRAGVGPADPGRPFSVALLLAWAARLSEDGPPSRGGFSFNPGRSLPVCGSECLHWASALAPGDLTVLRRSEAGLATAWGREVLHLGVLSELGLRAPDDWRVGLATGLCDLRVFRPGAGLGELAQAARLAGEKGEAEAFAQALAQADPSGRIRRALQAPRP